MKNRALDLIPRMGVVIVLLVLIIALSSVWEETQASNQASERQIGQESGQLHSTLELATNVPNRFSSFTARPGVELYRDSTGSEFVQVVSLARGASVTLLHGQKADPSPDPGGWGGPNPLFWRQSLEEAWNGFSQIDNEAFCITNGQFFSTAENPTPLAFSLKKDGEYISEGYAVGDDSRGEFPNQRLMLEIWEDRLDIVELTQSNFYGSEARNIIAGLTEDAPKNPTSSTTARTFVGIDDANNDGRFELLLVLSSSGSTQAAAATTLRNFGADKVMMLDGGGSTQLICDGLVPYVASSDNPDREIPQTIAISSSDSASGAAQFGLSWLENEAVAWQNRNNCIGCHVQPKAIQAAAIANDNGFTIDNNDLTTLMNFMKLRQRPGGDFGGWLIGEEHHTAPGFAAYDRSVSTDSTANLVSLANWLLSLQRADGSWRIDRHEPPVDQGDILVTANVITALAQAYNQTDDLRFSTAMQLGAHWLASQTSNAFTTQDKAQIIIGLIASGRPPDDPAVQAMVGTLKSEQRADNGWRDTAGGSSTAYGTGQVLYALRLAGVRLDDPVVQSGVDWLIAHQEELGNWPLTDNADPRRRSRYSPTMWGVLGLVQTVDLTPPSITAPILPVHVPKWVSLPIGIRDNIAGSGINPASIDVRVDDVTVPHFYIPVIDRVLVFVDPLETHTVTVDASDNQGNSAAQLVFSFTVDSSLLGVETVSPGNGAINVSIDSQFQATFNTAVDEATVNDVTVTLRDENNNQIPGTVDFDSTVNTASFQPVSPLDYRSYYVLTVHGGDNGVRDINGEPMVTDFQFGFRTRSASGDVTPPTVTAVDLQADGTIKVQFSEPMDPLTINGSTILVREQATGLDLSKTVSYDSLTDEALVTPLTPLIPDRVYEVQVISGLGGATDVSGNPLDEDFVAAIVTNTPPVADTGGPYTGDEGQSINFDASKSYDPDDDPLTFSWDFGDGNTGSSPSPTHAYTDPGTYDVCLIVTDGGGLSDTQCTTATVSNVAPSISVGKEADRSYVLTTGESVVYTVDIQNDSVATDPVSVSSILDNAFGEVLDPANSTVEWTDCTATTIQPGDNYSCQFEVLLQTDALGDHTNTVSVTALDDEGTEATDFGDTTIVVVPPSAVTDSSLCYFDREAGTDGQQFRLIFTPDMQLYPAYKLPASNPGQFYYNAFYTGTGPASFDITPPNSFVTKGAAPVHAYTGVSVANVNGFDCFVPDLATEIYAGNELELVDLPVPDGFLFVTVHFEYGLKGTTGYGQNYDGDAVDAETGAVLIANFAEHTFAVSGSQNDEHAIQNVNAFKRIPGIGGLVTDNAGNPLPGVTADVYDPEGVLLGSVTTDDDGWYMFEYKHKGKPADYTVALPAFGESTKVRLKGNGFAEASFVIDSP